MRVRLRHQRSCHGGGGGRSNGPYADSLPLSSHFEGGGGGGWVGGGSGGGGGLPDPNINGLK